MGHGLEVYDVNCVTLGMPLNLSAPCFPRWTMWVIPTLHYFSGLCVDSLQSHMWKALSKLWNIQALPCRVTGTQGRSLIIQPEESWKRSQKSWNQHSIFGTWVCQIKKGRMAWAEVWNVKRAVCVRVCVWVRAHARVRTFAQWISWEGKARKSWL